MGKLTALPTPQLDLRGPTSNGGRREGWGGDDREQERAMGRGEEGREGGKENGGEGREMDLSDQCEMLSTRLLLLRTHE